MYEVGAWIPLEMNTWGHTETCPRSYDARCYFNEPTTKSGKQN